MDLFTKFGTLPVHLVIILRDLTLPKSQNIHLCDVVENYSKINRFFTKDELRRISKTHKILDRRK